MIRGLALGLLVAGLSVCPAAASDDRLEGLLSELQITPLGDQTPPPFSLESLAGPPMSLAEPPGRAAFRYCWESG